MSEYISTTEAAEILGVSRVTVFNMIQDGRINEAIKVGRNYIIPKDFRKAFIKDIVQIILPILEKNDVKKAGIFGSFSCGQNRNNSDLDLLIKFGKKNKSLLDLINLKHQIEESLGKKVDLMTYDGIRPLLKEKILYQEIPIL